MTESEPKLDVVATVEVEYTCLCGESFMSVSVLKIITHLEYHLKNSVEVKRMQDKLYQ